MRIRQAVVLIHGIGEQRPFETLDSFVSAVAGDVDVRNKPDKINPLYELRRLQMPGDHNRPQTDFYELYWAHHMRDTKLRMIYSWMKSLMIKNPCHYSSKLLPFYLLGWLSLVLIASYILWPILKTLFSSPILGNLEIPISFGIVLVILIIEFFFIPFIYGYIGDAARYLNPDPDNISQRNKIRQEGIELLKKLHESKKYSRIIIVGHSLGSVIGYDIIRHYWSTLNLHGKFVQHKQIEPRIFAASADILNKKTDPDNSDIEEFQQAQHRLWREFRAIRYPWLITDFITLGSPLTHAPYLLAKKPQEFEIKKEQYEYPTCPPIEPTHKNLFFNRSVKCDEGSCTVAIPNHASPFCCTRWTNIFFPSKMIIGGDFISGPLSKVFGKGIKDMPLSLDPKRKLLTHLKYWSTYSSQGGRKTPAEILKNTLKLDCHQAKEKWPPP
ncbi:hypothetical protein KAR91_80095 [Candidatus Pacearchaeota archaeon]|nr:hypothetical protein [Candidatus Pacearchaeota archaeon]